MGRSLILLLIIMQVKQHIFKKWLRVNFV